jgi:hypothetical protein
MNILLQQTSSPEVACDLCPACKQPLELHHDIAAAVESAVASGILDAEAAARAESEARARHDAEERELLKTQRRKEVLEKFTAAQKCCVCVLAERSQSTKYFMHVFGTRFL